MADGGAAAVVWIPPRVDTLPPVARAQDRLRLLPDALRFSGVQRLGRYYRLLGMLARHHPHEAHYYCAFMAVAPAYQGRGLGAALLGTTLRRVVDPSGLPAYLENSNPRNTRLYERCGFVRQRILRARGLAPLEAMWREPVP